MTRLLVVLHMYYCGQADYFINKLRNINGCEWDLLVTYPNPSEEMQRKFSDFKPDCDFVQVENVGYDIWPFIKMIKSKDLDGYDLIMKLHTKNANIKRNRINGISLKRYYWRHLLVNALLKSPMQFRRVLSRFDDPQVGLVCSRELYKKTSDGLSEDLSRLDNELERIGMNAKDRHFCAGSMFICRKEVMMPFTGIDLSEVDFPFVSESHSTGSLAHIYERILCFAAGAEGYRISPIASDGIALVKSLFSKATTPVLEWIFSIKRIGEDRRKFITIFGFRIPVSE